MTRRAFAALPLLAATPLWAAPQQADAVSALRDWYRFSLMLVRHTPTCSPPVASRAFAYLGVFAQEVVALSNPGCASLAGQLAEFRPVAATSLDAASLPVALHAGFSVMFRALFGNTGPTGQRVLEAMIRRGDETFGTGLPGDTLAKARGTGVAVANHVLDWSATDGGATVDNLGFPASYSGPKGDGLWVPTNTLALQQTPLLPRWGENRPFAMPRQSACDLPPPPAYSEDPASAFYREALEVRDVTKSLTPEQKAIARFWSDDPMLSPTPPGHWISIALQVLDRQGADAVRMADCLARLGIAVADAFIACWRAKFEYNLLRPVTYIRRVIDPAFAPLLITPPFPEYPSGHSTQSGAAAAVLTALFGAGYAFEDATHVRDGLPARAYASFDAAADEAGISRLYGGIHFRSAIERGIEQGRCVGGFAAALTTRKAA